MRINDVIATNADLQSLQPQSVERIEYIDRPGAKYGEGIGIVVNIIVRQPATGYVAGAGGTWMPRADLAKWNTERLKVGIFLKNILKTGRMK